MKKNPTPTLPLSGEGAKAQKASTALAPPPPPDKGEAGRGSRPQKLHNLKHQETTRRKLRKFPTEPEKRFWSWVRNKQLGVKFRRQHGIGRFIVDFYCAEHSLIVEIDGDSHYSPESIEHDIVRSKFFIARGFHVVRFTNLEIMQNKEGVLTALTKRLNSEETHG